MKLSEEDAATVASAELAKLALELTPPLAQGGGQGMSLEAKRAGFNAVARDIKGLFVAVDDQKSGAVAVALNNMKLAIKANDRGKFERIRQQATLRKSSLINRVTTGIVYDSDPERAFKKARNFFSKSNPSPNISAGQITKDLRGVHLKHRHISRDGRMKTWKHTGNYMGKYVAESKNALENYIKATQAHVGFIKSGWYEVLNQLPKVGGKRTFKAGNIPSWIKRHSGNGYVTYIRSAVGLRLTIGNKIGDTDNQASKNNVHGVAMTIAIRRFDARINQMQKRAFDEFNADI